MGHPSNAWKGIVIPVLVLLAVAIATRRHGVAIVAVAVGAVLGLAGWLTRDVAPPRDDAARDAPLPLRIAPPTSGPYLEVALFAAGDANPLLPAGTPLPATATAGLLITQAGESSAALDLATTDGRAGAEPTPWCRVQASFASPLAPGEVAAVEFVLRLDAIGTLHAEAREEGRALLVVADDEARRALPVARALS
jgi:hypothetical protein